MEIVKLKNGSEEALPLVTVTMMTLRKLLESEPILFYEAVMIARSPDHQPFGNTAQDLNQLSLTKGGKMHGSIRNVILSAVSGDGLDMILDSPVLANG